MTEEEKIYSKLWSFYLGNQRLWANLFLEIFLVASKIEIHRMLFVSDNIMSKVLKNFLWWSHFLIKTQDYSLQLRTTLNSITDDFMTIFWNSCTNNFVKFPGEHVQFTFNVIARLQPIAYYWTKASIADTFLEILRMERMF